jgi:hypothetical protein
MKNFRLVMTIAVLMLGAAVALLMFGFVRLPLALTILVLFALVWAVEILRCRPAGAQRETRS